MNAQTNSDTSMYLFLAIMACWAFLAFILHPKTKRIISWLWRAFKRIVGFSIGLASAYGFILLCCTSNGLGDKPFAQWTPNNLIASLGLGILAIVFMILAPLFFWLSCKRYRTAR